MHLKSKLVKELCVSVKYRASLLESKTSPSLGSWINGKARISADSTANSLRWFCVSVSAFGEYHYSFIPRLISEVMRLSPMSKRVCISTETRFVCKRYRRPTEELRHCCATENRGLLSSFIVQPLVNNP